MSSLTLPGGRDKGKPLSDVDESSLKWWREKLEDNLAKGTARGNDKPLRDAIVAEQERRLKTGTSHIKAPATSTALAAPASLDWLTKIQGSFREGKNATHQLQIAQQNANLISPATSCGHLPEGCAVAFSIVHVDAREVKHGGEIYSVGGGKFGIVGSGLNRMAAAAGISWDPELTGRIDDGSDPCFCAFRAVGDVRDFDGTERALTGNVEIDMRDGSPQVDAMHQRSQSGNADVQIRDTKFFIVRHAESKAKNRAIRSMGMKGSYTLDELQKPFVVAKLMFTGQSDNPQIAMRFAELQALRMLGGKRALFGPGGIQAPVLSPPGMMRPPPVGNTPAFDPDDDWRNTGAIDTSGEPVPSLAEGEKPKPEERKSDPPPGGKTDATANPKTAAGAHAAGTAAQPATQGGLPLDQPKGGY